MAYCSEDFYVCEKDLFIKLQWNVKIWLYGIGIIQTHFPQNFTQKIDFLHDFFCIKGFDLKLISNQYQRQ